MTLSQKLLELGEDRLRSLALRATFWQNLRALGLTEALRCADAQRARRAAARAIASSVGTAMSRRRPATVTSARTWREGTKSRVEGRPLEAV